MRTNVKTNQFNETNHEGIQAIRLTPVQELRRSVMANLLWENEFYEDGVANAERVAKLAATVKPSELSAVAVEARQVHNLRHMPLLLAATLAKTAKGSVVADTIEAVIQRADELTEFFAIYAKINGLNLAAFPNNLEKHISNQVRKGVARAFVKFDEYQLAKYNRAGAISLKSVMFLTHPKPKDEAQAEVWKRLVDGTLMVPDTWETAISAAGKDLEKKRAEWLRLITPNDYGAYRLGDFAFIRNLRNLDQAGIDHAVIKAAFKGRKWKRILPFRFVAAARMAPWAERELDEALISTLGDLPKLRGKTAVVVDVSPSMYSSLSAKSDLRRDDAAAILAGIVQADDLRVFAFSDTIAEAPARRGMAAVDAIKRAVPSNGTKLGNAVRHVNGMGFERVIVITDEESQDPVPPPVAPKAYMINVASYKNAVAYGRWVRIEGFSENVIKYIHDYEQGFGDEVGGAEDRTPDVRGGPKRRRQRDELDD